MEDKDKQVEVKKAATPVRAERMEEAVVFTPMVDIYEADEAALLVADLPGCDESSVAIQYEDGVLTVRGRVKPEGLEGYDATLAEYRIGDFERSFSVSELVDPSKIGASVKDGVLRVTLPKIEAARPRKISVTSG